MLGVKMVNMKEYEYIRTGHFVYEKSIRQLQRETGHSRQTIRKVIEGVYPKYHIKKEKVCPAIGDYKEIIKSWLEKDIEIHRKQRHTGVRIYTRLKNEHNYNGSESTILKYVGNLKREMGLSRREVFIPLEQTFGEAEVDWGEAIVKICGEEKKVKLFAIRAQGSGGIFARAYPSENLESFLEAHIYAFMFFGGVFKTIRYDNLKAAIQKVLKGRDRVEQERFHDFHRYYSYEAVFCNVAKGNEKGGVEGIVGYSRRNFLVPIPEVESFEELNYILSRNCISYQIKKVGERKASVEALLVEEQKKLLPLPKEEFSCWKMRNVKVDHYSTIRFESNRYSVPTDYGYRDLELRAYPFKIMLFDRTQMIAEHKRNYENEQWILEPMHYLRLLSRKIRAFDRAKPINILKNSWPKIYDNLLIILQNRYGEADGNRQLIDILLLQKEHKPEDVETAIDLALETGGVSYDVIRHILTWTSQEEKKPDILNLSPNSYLSKISVQTPSTLHYGMLIRGNQE